MFPDFNIYSLPLLILVTQGLILALLLFIRFFKEQKVSDIVLASLVLITCYHRTTYTIGFMGWYDTFRNTKINYYLISLVLAIGPLIFYYIKSAIQRDFEFTKRDFIHFVPVLSYILFSLVVFIYDRGQTGFEETQNGPFYLWMMEYLTVILAIIFSIQLLVYLFLSFRLYNSFRKQLEDEYSNTYKYELRWLRNFLYVFTFLFVYDSIQMLTDEYFIDLHWTQEWWYQFFSLLIVIYVGVMGYFTSFSDLAKVDLTSNASSLTNKKEQSLDYTLELEKLRQLVEGDKLYLDPNLTLSQLSRKSKINTSQLSFIINKGLNKNFNDFINGYRVDEVKAMLLDPNKSNLSILAIAYDSGFSSKATFNRVFKRIAGKSPSAFRNNPTS